MTWSFPWQKMQSSGVIEIKTSKLWIEVASNLWWGFSKSCIFIFEELSYLSFDFNYVWNYCKPSNLLWTWIISRSWASKFDTWTSLDQKINMFESHIGSPKVIGGRPDWFNWLTPSIHSFAYSRAISQLVTTKKCRYVSLCCH